MIRHTAYLLSARPGVLVGEGPGHLREEGFFDLIGNSFDLCRLDENFPVPFHPSTVLINVEVARKFTWPGNSSLPTME